MTGYRKMINDRIPFIWDIGLRWCRCKTAWIEFIYNSCVKPYKNDVMHNEHQKKKLKETNIKRSCDVHNGFQYSLNLDILLQKSKAEYEFWKNVSNWVNWFSKHYEYIAIAVEIENSTYDTPENELINYINDRFKLDNIDLSKFIIKEVKRTHRLKRV